VLATFLAFGVLINFWSFGFLRYWQRQGFCSLILLQHRLVGGVEDVIALTQELSCAGLHVTASTLACSLARSSTKRVQTTIQDVLIFTWSKKIGWIHNTRYVRAWVSEPERFEGCAVHLAWQPSRFIEEQRRKRKYKMIKQWSAIGIFLFFTTGLASSYQTIWKEEKLKFRVHHDHCHFSSRKSTLYKHRKCVFVCGVSGVNKCLDYSGKVKTIFNFSFH
jgi:hypothetical protein